LRFNRSQPEKEALMSSRVLALVLASSLPFAALEATAQGRQSSQAGGEASLIKPPPDATMIGSAVIDEIRAFPEMSGKSGGGGAKAKAQAAKIVNVQGIDRTFETRRPFADAVAYFDQQFKQTGYEVMARVDSPSATAWTVKRPDGTVANAVVRNTKPTTIELAEVSGAAAKIEIQK
jgi:hypothetical protein